MFGFIALAHVGLCVFGLVRIAAPARRRANGRAMSTSPRTSFLIGRLLRRGNGSPDSVTHRKG
jgi:hypothetical protein